MPLATTADVPLSIGRPTKPNSQPIEVESPERVNNSSIGVGGSDVDASSVSISPGSNANGAMPLPMLDGRETRRLEWTAAGPTGTVDGRTRGDFCRLQAVQNADLLAGEVDLVSAREDSDFCATQGELVGSVMFGAEEIGVETAEIAFLSEPQYMNNFLNSIDIDGSSKGTYFSCLEEVLPSEVTCVRDDYQYGFATSESYPAIGHVGEVENPPLRFSDIKHLKLTELRHGATKTEFNGLVDLRAFAFGVKVPRGSNVVSACWVFTWKVDKAGCVIKPKARLVARGFSQVHTVDFMETYSPTPKALSVKTAVAVAVERDWELRQLDVAFIQADLDYGVSMKLPDGCGDKSGEIVKLNKAVYGLKQAGRQWSLRLIQVLTRVFFD